MSDAVGTQAAPPTQTSRRVVRVYFWSRLQHRRLVRLQAWLFAGLWLGVLTPADLDNVDDTFYVGDRLDRQSPIDYTGGEYNRQGLFTWEGRAIDEHFSGLGSLALMAAGGGREVLALARKGFRVDAWECQPRFVTAANALLVAEGFEPTVVYARRNEVPPAVRRCDGAVVGWGAYSLIPTRDRRIAVLRELRARLEPGAPILVSFLTRHPSDPQFRVVAALANTVRFVLRRDRVEVGDVLQPNFLHLFVEDELDEELAAGGFQMLSFAQEPYGHAVAVAVEP